MAVVVITVAVMAVVMVNATAIVVHPIKRILLVASPTPIARHTGDATTHQPTVGKKVRFTRMM